jgi:hypothetical protein
MNEKIKDLMEETRKALSERLEQIENASYEERIAFDWRGHLSSLWEAVETNFDANCPEILTELFLTQIWKISRLNVGELRLDGESKQVNVIVDNDDKLFFSNNTAYLSLAINHHEDETESSTIEFPIRSWIMTKPSGKADIERNDWDIIDYWGDKISNCIVLGNNEYLAYDIKEDLGKKVYYGRLRNNDNKTD